MAECIIFTQTYYVLCVFVAISLTSWCIHEYHLDKDISNIVLRKFHDTEDDIHPSITLCRKDPFDYYLKSTIVDYDDREQNEILHLYSSFLSGIESENFPFTSSLLKDMNKIEYDNISVSLEDIIKEVIISYPVKLDEYYDSKFSTSGNLLMFNKNLSSKPKEINWNDFKTFDHIDTYISARNEVYKCFTFDVPLIKGKNIRRIAIRFQERPDGIDGGLYYFMLTYPNQTLQVSRGNQIEVGKYLTSKPTCYKFEIFVGRMEAFKRRNKPNERCNEDWKHHDEKQLNTIINEVGCNPKHWYRQSELPNCSTVEEYKKINQQYFEKDKFQPPCRSIESISKVTKGTDFGWRCDKKYLEVIAYLDEERFYKEISLVEAYTFQSLIGNAGKIIAD